MFGKSRLLLLVVALQEWVMADLSDGLSFFLFLFGDALNEVDSLGILDLFAIYLLSDLYLH